MFKQFIGIKVASVIIIFCMLFTFTSCSRLAGKNSGPLSIGILPDVDSIPLVIAKQNGYFEKEGVTVTVERFKSALDRDSALQSGKIDGAVSDMLAAAFAAEGGFEVKMTSKTDGSYKMLAGKDAGIRGFADIQGKDVAISKNTIIEFATDAMLAANNVDPEKINKVVIPQIPVRLEMLQNGKVHAATLPEPLATVAVKNGAAVINSTDQLGINPGVLLFTKSAVTAKSAQIKAFYKAYNRAVEYLEKEDMSKYIDLLIKEAGFPEAVKDSLVLPAYAKARQPSEDDFASVIKWLKDKDLIKKTYRYEDLVDSKFVR